MLRMAVKTRRKRVEVGATPKIAAKISSSRLLDVDAPPNSAISGDNPSKRPQTVTGTPQGSDGEPEDLNDLPHGCPFRGIHSV
jgi:hypothetical protein